MGGLAGKVFGGKCARYALLAGDFWQKMWILAGKVLAGKSIDILK